MDLFYKIVRLQEELADLHKLHFEKNALFSYQWWILVITVLVLWGLWLILVDRKRLKNLLLVGLFSMGFALVLDDIGLSTGLWNYPYKIVFFTTRLTPVDMVILPVAFMLIFQYCRKWIPFIIFCMLFSAFASFVAEPIFVKLNMYSMMHWKYIYSAPIYVAIGIIIKGAADLTDLIERKAREKS